MLTINQIVFLVLTVYIFKENFYKSITLTYLRYKFRATKSNQPIYAGGCIN